MTDHDHKWTPKTAPWHWRHAVYGIGRNGGNTPWWCQQCQAEVVWVGRLTDLWGRCPHASCSARAEIFPDGWGEIIYYGRPDQTALALWTNCRQGPSAYPWHIPWKEEIHDDDLAETQADA